MTYNEVADLIERFVNGTGDPLDWDGYTMGTKFADPFLRSIQDRCRALWIEFPPTEKGHYTNAEGLAVLRELVAELRARAQSPARSERDREDP
jgi:hypothetical protein